MFTIFYLCDDRLEDKYLPHDREGDRFNLSFITPGVVLITPGVVTYLYCQSINITDDWRAIYSETLENKEKVAIFLVLGTHSQLYK